MRPHDLTHLWLAAIDFDQHVPWRTRQTRSRRNHCPYPQACAHKAALIVTRIRDLLDRDLSRPIEENATDRIQAVLRKKETQEFILRELFRDRGASLIQNVKLERCSRRTEFDEDEFVQLYPYLPHLIDLSIDIALGIQQHPNAPKRGAGGNRSIPTLAFEMLVSERTLLADQPVGVLVSIDKIYELVEGSLPPERRKDVLDVRQRFDGDKDYPGMAGRVAKAICLMEFVQTDFERTAKNIAALLVQSVTEAPPIFAVNAMLYAMQQAQFARETEGGWTLFDFEELRRAPDALEGLKNAVGTVNPRPPGWHNDLIQFVKRSVARGLAWYVRPQYDFDALVTRTLGTIIWGLDHLSRNVAANLSTNMVAFDRHSMDLVALEKRLAQSEKRNACLAESMQQMQEQLDLLHQQVRTLPKSENRRTADRTAYVIGLFGSGRRYINELILDNIGERAQYFRDTIRLHPGPTPMIYSGHATMRHVSRGQESPAVMSRILEAVGSGFANLIFVYRHPLDSLLTNWIWWRTFLRDNKSISGVSQVHKTTDHLCADLEQNFLDFESFAAGDHDFFTGAPGPRFLSLPEFVEETELHLESTALALRLEDFTIDPCKEFSKIVEVLSVDLDLSRLCIAPPRTKPYGYLAVKDKVPRFRDFIDGLNAETKRRIERIGYNVGG